MSSDFRSLPIDGLVLIEPGIFSDSRGTFMETFKASEFCERKLESIFPQDNHSVSARGVLRGLHFQKPPHAQAKLVRVIAGAAWDVAVDLRRHSSSYGRWFGIELSAENRKILFIPQGFAHGFVALADGTELLYKCSVEYHKDSESGVRWDDPDLAITWPMADVTLSAKDSALPFLRDLS